jgi:hypothetical protein
MPYEYKISNFVKKNIYNVNNVYLSIVINVNNEFVFFFIIILYNSISILDFMKKN